MIRIASPLTRKKPRIEIIPLIDIVFFLLATFMLVSLSMISGRALKVNLPNATNAQQETGAQHNVVAINKQGVISLNGVSIEKNELANNLNQLKSSSNQASLYIEADKEAQFADVVVVLDAAQQVGLNAVGIGTSLAKASEQ